MNRLFSRTIKLSRVIMPLNLGIIQIFIGFLRKKIMIKKKVKRRYIKKLLNHGETQKK